jgi:segregation and condensation protein A
LSGISLDDLVEAARAILSHSRLQAELKTVVAPSPITIRQKINQIITFLKSKGNTSFRTFIQSARTRLEIVVTFLAVLELIKRHHIQAHQETNFGEIQIETTGTLDPEAEFELEFGE